MKTLDLKKKRLIGKKEIIVMVSAIILTTAGIKASDTLLNKDGDETAIGANGCPVDMVFVSSASGGFCIDKFEASVGDGCPNGTPGSQDQSRDNLNASRCKPASKSGAKPWRNISQNQAAVACAKAGKRLPTNKEWLAASLGTPDKKSGWAEDDCQVSKNWGEQPGPAGSGADCVSGAGALDMIGNVWEWVDGTAEDGVYQGQTLPRKGYIKGINESGLPSETATDAGDENYNGDYFFIVNSGTRAFARGGYWDSNSDAGQYSVYLESAPSFAGIGVGFRCAK